MSINRLIVNPECFSDDLSMVGDHGAVAKFVKPGDNFFNEELKDR